MHFTTVFIGLLYATNKSLPEYLLFPDCLYVTVKHNIICDGKGVHISTKFMIVSTVVELLDSTITTTLAEIVVIFHGVYFLYILPGDGL